MMDHPGLARFIAQAWIGYIVSNFTLILARILLVPEQGNDWFVFWLVVVFIFGLGVGTAAGLIWFGQRFSADISRLVSRFFLRD